MNKLILAATLSSMTFSISAIDLQKSMKMGTGNQANSYYKMGSDIVDYCSDSTINYKLTVHESKGGSTENLLGMQNKKYSLGMVQEDVLAYYGKRNPKRVNENSLKVVTPLHGESFHILVPTNYMPSTGKKGMWGNIMKTFSSDDKPQKLDLDLLTGQTIGAWGGSVVSAEAMSYFFKLNLNVTETSQANVESNSFKDPIFIVAGQPSTFVQKLLSTGSWRLMALDADSIVDRAPLYSKDTLSYSFGGKVQSTPSVSVQALLVGKSFRKESRNAPMESLASCINESLVDLADDPDTSPNWASVYDYVDNDSQPQWASVPLL